MSIEEPPPNLSHSPHLWQAYRKLQQLQPPVDSPTGGNRVKYLAELAKICSHIEFAAEEELTQYNRDHPFYIIKHRDFGTIRASSATPKHSPSPSDGQVAGAVTIIIILFLTATIWLCLTY